MNNHAIKVNGTRESMSGNDIVRVTLADGKEFVLTADDAYRLGIALSKAGDAIATGSDEKYGVTTLNGIERGTLCY